MSWDTGSRKTRPKEPAKKKSGGGLGGIGLIENAPDLSQLVDNIEENVSALQTRRKYKVWEDRCKC
jgi:hypothetical protein